MKLALFYNLQFTTVNINLEKYVILQLNFMSNLLILIYWGGGGHELLKHFKGAQAINIWEPLVYLLKKSAVK
jgi:hypothetical protein